jgi:ubiquinone/menaquinone biosynthesis C-methylase UbiE
MNWTHDYFEEGYARRWQLGPPSPDTEREVHTLWTHLNLSAGALVLDVGCGHGRYALGFASHDAWVAGLDGAASLLARATELAHMLGVAVNWVRGDMRHLPVRAQSMHAALLFDAFGFFEAEEENQTVIRELARVLVRGGRIAIKVVNAEPLLAHFRHSDRQVRGETTIEIERSLLSGPPRLIERLKIPGPQGIGTYERRQRLYRLPELLDALESAGFTSVSTFATLEGVPFDASTSPSIVIIAERR